MHTKFHINRLRIRENGKSKFADFGTYVKLEIFTFVNEIFICETQISLIAFH